MKRFLVFPLVLGICGALFSTFCFAQFAAVVIVGVSAAVGSANPRLSPMQDAYLHQLSTVFLSSYIVGIIFGILTGLALAIWDKVRNGPTGKKLVLLQNISWCLFYALLFSIPNHGVGLFYLYGYTPIKFFGVLPIISLLLLNFTAILWAAIRSIQTDDILTPRVLRAKLRRSSRL